MTNPDNGSTPWVITSGNPCNGDELTFELAPNPLNTFCTNWPATITATPINCP